MKKQLLILSMLAIALSSAFAQKISIVNGTWDRGKAESLNLYRIMENSQLEQIASTKVGADKKFYFAFSPVQEGIYIVGLQPTKMHQYPFYFKAGDNLNINITRDSYFLEGENTPENVEMTKWHDFIQPVESKAVYFMGKNSTYVDFFPLLDEKAEAFKTYPKSNTPNSLFNNTFENFKKFDLLSDALTFIQTPRSAHPQGEDFSDYYRNISIADLTQSAAILKYPAGLNLVSRALMMVAGMDTTVTAEQKKQQGRNMEAIVLAGKQFPNVANDTIKGELVLLVAKSNSTYEGIQEFGSKYTKYLNTENQKERFKTMQTDLFAKAGSGVEAIDFKFADKDGKEIALSSFKGKVVYVDVWATWCAPCKKEIPFLKELEKQYHSNPNIVFLSVSVDASKDYQKWKDFVQKEELGGVQIFAGDAGRKGLMEPYQIKGIPRFLLVGKDGKIISSDAPRPSATEIKAVLEGALKK